MNHLSPSRKFGILLGGTLSFAMSLVGMLSARAFSLPSFLINVLISFLISQVITTLISVPQITSYCTAKMHLDSGTVKFRAVSSLISDLLMTPLMSGIMVYLAYRNAVNHGARIPFVPMLLRSLLISLIVSFVLIYFLTPLYQRIVFQRKDR